MWSLLYASAYISIAHETQLESQFYEAIHATPSYDMEDIAELDELYDDLLDNDVEVTDAEFEQLVNEMNPAVLNKENIQV